MCLCALYAFIRYNIGRRHRRRHTKVWANRIGSKKDTVEAITIGNSREAETEHREKNLNSSLNVRKWIMCKLVSFVGNFLLLLLLCVVDAFQQKHKFEHDKHCRRNVKAYILTPMVSSIWKTKNYSTVVAFSVTDSNATHPHRWKLIVACLIFRHIVAGCVCIASTSC